MVVRRFNFGYSDNTLNSNRDNERLTLLSLRESGTSEAAKPAYEFTYNNQNLPPYLSNKVDHWGFFNDTDAPIATQADLLAYHTRREPTTDSLVYLQGLLTQIKYPTGGHTEFWYEQHRYAKQLSDDRLSVAPAPTPSTNAGGVRIRKILSFPAANSTVKLGKRYYYVTGYSNGVNPSTLASSGVLGGQSKYYYEDTRFQGWGPNNVWFFKRIFSSQSVLPAANNAKGSHVGYSEVVEQLSNGGYTKFQYSNFDNGNGSNLDERAANSLVVTRTPYDPYSSLEENRGTLTREAAFNLTNQPVRLRELTYVALNKSTEFVPALYAVTDQPCLNYNAALVEATPYKLYTYSYLPELETETLYDNTGVSGVTTVKTYSYNAQRLLTQQTLLDGNGQEVKTTYRYPFDVSYTGPNPYVSTTQGILLSTTRNIISTPIEAVYYRNGFITGGTVTLPALTNSTFVAPYQIYEFETTQSIAANQYTSLFFPSRSDNYISPALDQKYKLRQTFNTYDANGNLLNDVKEGQQNSSYLWDYNKTLLVAKVANATPSQIAYTGFEADGPSFVGNTFQSAGPYAWDHDPRLGQTVHLQRTGGMTGNGFYRLDGNWGVGRNHLPVGDYEVTFWAKGGFANVYVFATQELSRSEGPSNAQGYSLVRFRVHVANGSIGIDAYRRLVDIDDVRLYPVGAQMTTYTHDPLVGVTSISDSNCRPTFYDYDGLQRLQIVRDAEGSIVKHLEYNYQR